MATGEIVALALFVLSWVLFVFAFTGPVRRHHPQWSILLIPLAVTVMTLAALSFTLTHQF
ncbi:hypothetical protein [Arsenicicoccus dermatophilus]|uniref:hypothetical protein n=1 Tax=Arsenicicoccus dermatophilus TaxID=1076331 RepID=UPI001F4C5FCA|nr:hypothetical protein [Arsenicicoccus dermatophilus]MCH8614237.1 hypothetical protein [Arsenicicoccus dermatophilus]